MVDSTDGEPSLFLVIKHLKNVLTNYFHFVVETKEKGSASSWKIIHPLPVCPIFLKNKAIVQQQGQMGGLDGKRSDNKHRTKRS